MNSHIFAASDDFVSLFERVFDVAVVGAGLIGFAAARALAKTGVSVCWLEPSGDLLWEVSRALENRCATGKSSADLEQWLDSLREWEGVRNGYFDAALAEIVAAREAVALRPRVATLFYAVPVAVERVGEDIAAVTLMTKGGARPVRARQWIDTTETGQLVSLCDPQSTGQAGREPSACFGSIALQSAEWAEFEPKLQKFLGDRPGVQLHPSARISERRLMIPNTPGSSWHQRVTQEVEALRQEFPEAKILVSHISLRDLPVYLATENAPAVELPSNLLVLSPAWSSDRFETAGDRFAEGTTAPARLKHLSRLEGELPVFAAANAISPATEEVSCDVLVAGTGTAGTVAAIAAARSGAKTIALELASFPGGIGAGGGISIYFHGASGGLQDELDAATAQISALLGAKSSTASWHHDAKKLAIRDRFDAAGVVFHGETLLCGVDRDDAGNVLSVLAAKEGRVVRYRAKAFIDSTGDGDLCVLAGADSVKGRPGDGRTLSYSQVSLFMKESEGAYSIGILNYDAGWADATDPEDFTRARLEGVSLHLYGDWPVEDRPFLLSPLLGVRQTRHIITDVQITMDDLIVRSRFDDAVGRAEAIADTHSVDYEFESDDMLFYLWVCRSFSYPLQTELPYRMLLPQGLNNVWVACRAAGVDVDASYCVRMQRDMQRLGEVAGVAAGLSVKGEKDTRHPDWENLREALERSGAYRKTAQPEHSQPTDDELLARLDSGESGIHLWQLSRRADLRDDVVSRLRSVSPSVTFYAAAVLGFQGDSRAEERLLQAIKHREIGERHNPKASLGAYGQVVDIPFWLQAVALLRQCGTPCCLPVLDGLISTDNPFNVRTLAALTFERLAGRYGRLPGIEAAVESLLATEDVSSSQLAPSRSLWKTLHGEAQSFAASWGVDARQDHSWQLCLIAVRIANLLGMEFPAKARRYLRDPRTYVREAFVIHSPKPSSL